MPVYAAVTTAKGPGAISTIELSGKRSQAILEKIFTPLSSEGFNAGNILVGTISDSDKTIDQVAIGCESDNHIAIHCHGNPLITESIMKLLKANGVALVTKAQFLCNDRTAKTAIHHEVQTAMPKLKTLFASKLILNQVTAGLSKCAESWLKNKNIDQIKKESTEILNKSHAARTILKGCNVVIIGPPNSGKSSLLNILSGKDKAIVTAIEGTTRDYVTSEIILEDIFFQITDTAGIDEILALSSDIIEKNSQDKSLQILQQADLVLLVIDGSRDDYHIPQALTEAIKDKKVIICLNKSDLPRKFPKTSLPAEYKNRISISTKAPQSIETLKMHLQQICTVADLNIDTPIVFTDRQRQLLSKLSKINSADQANLLITELLNGQLNV